MDYAKKKLFVEELRGDSARFVLEKLNSLSEVTEVRLHKVISRPTSHKHRHNTRNKNLKQYLTIAHCSN